MACFHPLKAFRGPSGASGRRSVVFTPSAALSDHPIQLPCGQCVACRLDRSLQWATRCMHEASLYERNCFLTLTYDDNNLPDGNSLVTRDFQLFMKRLRKFAGANIRFYQCGEYGETYGRPHYHACIFNYDFNDKVFLKKTPAGDNLYTSAKLQQLWPSGMSSIGDVTFQSAAYVARYILKKITGDLAFKKYATVSNDGNLMLKKPEYTTMSRRPGIGTIWLDQYGQASFNHDNIIVNGKRAKLPRHYDNYFDLHNPGNPLNYELLTPLERIKQKRRIRAAKHSDNNTPQRLADRETVALAKINLFPRKLDK